MAMRSFESLANIFRETREKLYYLTEHRAAPEREWETAEQEEEREQANRAQKAAWDAETEAIIRGD
jgi:hypothetical protein